MSLTVKDYQDALDALVGVLRELDDELASALLHGSMVRGDLRPGSSDIDIFLFLQDRVFTDKAAFLRAIEIIVEACTELALRAIPFESVHYFSLDEIDCIRATFLPAWQAERPSTVLCGQDVRAQISSSEASRFSVRQAIFQARRMCHPLAKYLGNDEHLTRDWPRIKDFLQSLERRIPQLACVALDIWVDVPEAMQALERALPELETDALKKIQLLRQQSEDIDDIGERRELLRDALQFVEQLHDALILKTKE